jgi:hypothetical protein
MLANSCGYRVAIAVTKIRFRILVSKTLKGVTICRHFRYRAAPEDAARNYSDDAGVQFSANRLGWPAKELRNETRIRVDRRVVCHRNGICAVLLPDA